MRREIADLSPFQGETLNWTVPRVKTWAEGYNPFGAQTSSILIPEPFGP
jgi:hypothetical protein